jgi:hypothetical protein
MAHNSFVNQEAGPSAGAGEASFRAEPATVGGSIPLARSIPTFSWSDG